MGLVFGSGPGYGGLCFRHYDSVIRQLNVGVFKSIAIDIALERSKVFLT